MLRAASFLLLLAPLGCERTPHLRDLTESEWQELVQGRQMPTAAYVWASWSRESVELLPTILELEQEYEGRVEFLYVSLDVDDPKVAAALMREANGPPSYRMAVSLEEALGALGISEPPALVGYQQGAALEMIEGDALYPAAADAMVGDLAANHL